jgi:hypothetical protein
MPYDIMGQKAGLQGKKLNWRERVEIIQAGL